MRTTSKPAPPSIPEKLDKMIADRLTRYSTKPPPVMGLGFVVKVPEAVCDKKEAKVVGFEWAPDSNRLKGNGWCYYLRFKDSVGEAFVADEQEVLKWQQS